MAYGNWGAQRVGMPFSALVRCSSAVISNGPNYWSTFDDLTTT
jgi:hypothetical protein